MRTVNKNKPSRSTAPELQKFHPKLGRRTFFWWIATWFSTMGLMILFALAWIMMSRTLFFECIADWNVWLLLASGASAAVFGIAVVNQYKAMSLVADDLISAGYKLRIFRAAERILIRVIDGIF
jgi:hypothetical protein